MALQLEVGQNVRVGVPDLDLLVVGECQHSRDVLLCEAVIVEDKSQRTPTVPPAERRVISPQIAVRLSRLQEREAIWPLVPLR